MPLDLTSDRQGPVEHLANQGGVTLASLPPASRFILRLRPDGMLPIASAFGVALPQRACRAAATDDSRAALWLGPDEWLLLAPVTESAALAAALEHAAEGTPHSLVDVSHRQIGIDIAGPTAAMTLNAGCPLDLDLAAFPVGMCTRTVFGKSEIVLWRTGEARFHIEVWRSFAPYVWHLLEEASREFCA